jgi:serine/threonine-protein kinase
MEATVEPNSWRKVEEIFQNALDLPEEEREVYLAEVAGEGTALRGELDALLDAHQSSGSFLEEPVVDAGISQIIREKKKDDFRNRSIGPYRLLKKLGEGGMSRVYLAVRDDDEYQKLVALKVIPQDLDRRDLRRRFRTERQILASLDHTHIAKLLDGGTTRDGLPYFVMDYIEGMAIDEYCDRNRLSVPERLELFRTVCAAVQYAHQNLVVHRDIKASNILVTADGTPKLLDFGIAKLLKPAAFAAPVEFTATRIRPMTPSYASPEQIRGRHITTATDIYSLGVLLYKLLTGRLPHELEKKTPREMEQAILEVEPERPSTVVSRLKALTTVSTELASEGTIETPVRIQPSQLRRRLSGDLDNIAMMALRKEPSRRYASVEMLSEDVRRHVAGLPVLAHKDSLHYRVGKFMRRNRIAIAVAVGFAVLLIGFAVTMAVQAQHLAQERDQVQLERDRSEQVVALMEEIFGYSNPEETAASADSISARDILDRARRRLPHELKGQPITQAGLMEVIGNLYYSLGLFEGAETLQRDALKILRRELGEEHQLVAQSKGSLGVTLRATGQFDESKRLLEEALATRESLFGEEHRLVAHSLVQLAQLYVEQGEEVERAETLFSQALEIQLKTLGEDDPAVADTLSEMGILLAEAKGPTEAEAVFERSLEIRRNALGDNNPRVAESLNNLGAIIGMLGRHEESLPLLREALEIRERVLGPEHPETGQSLNNLGRSLREVGDLAGAEALYRQALELFEHAYGFRSPKVAYPLSNLGAVLREQGEFQEAELLLRRSLSIRRETLPPDSHQIGWSLNNLGLLLIRKGEYTEAQRLINEALEIYRETVGDHWRTAEARTFLGEAFLGRGLFEESEEQLAEGYTSLRDQLGIHHRRTRDAADRLARLYEAWGKPGEAARYRALLEE